MNYNHPVQNLYSEQVCPRSEEICPVDMFPNTLETASLVVHIFLTIVPIVFSVALAVLVSWNSHISRDTCRFLIEFLIIVVPIILNVTVLNEFVEVQILIFLIIAFLVYKDVTASTLIEPEETVCLGRQPVVLTLVRSTTNIITAVCILAVDFTIFPESFRKSYYYRVGLMDTGIGLFVFCMAVVSKSIATWKDLNSLLKTSLVIIVLGCGRTFVIRLIDYHQDETEYGTHMNSFFTLGLSRLFGGIISTCASKDYHLLAFGIVILIVHEVVLLYGMADFVLDIYGKRNTIFRANREGICSLPGFIATYLISMYIGRLIFSNATPRKEEYSRKVKQLGFLTFALWLLLFICIPSVGISRRICNLGYVVWILSIACSILLLYIVICDYLCITSAAVKKPETPLVMQATNLNGLVFFVVANLLTGAVNICIETPEYGRLASITVLCVYMFLCSTIAFVLLKMRIRIA